MQAEGEASDHPEIGAGAANTPEQVCVLLGTGDADRAVALSCTISAASRLSTVHPKRRVGSYPDPHHQREPADADL